MFPLGVGEPTLVSTRAGRHRAQEDASTKESAMPTETEKQERAKTRRALDTLADWGRDPGSDGGENVAFSLVRQGGLSNAFQVSGDCTPFTASGARGVLHGQPAGDTGAPAAYVVDLSSSTPTVDEIPCTFDFDLNAGSVTLAGAFPGTASTLTFHVERLKGFDDPGVGDTVLFCSQTSSDHSGYVLAVCHVAAE
jgi:hypothetical protein